MEEEILSKPAQGDEALWKRLAEVRSSIDILYDEKLMLVKKMFNLGQKFVQELEVQNAEQFKHIQQNETTTKG